MTRHLQPTIRIESFSSPETGVAGEDQRSADAGHKAQEKVRRVTEPVDAERAHSKSQTDSDDGWTERKLSCE